jgi:hypothetical protein
VIEMGPQPRIRDDLDRRIELVSMDRYAEDITLALYLMDDGASAVVHSYSSRQFVPERLAWLAQAMRTLGGLVGEDRSVAFPCGTWHELAARRVFLEACKLDPATEVEVRPLDVYDGRTDQAVHVTALGAGTYQVFAVPADPAAASRAPAIAAGLAKLGGMDVDPIDPTVVRFLCGAPHDEIVGVLLPRAINVRAALREIEAEATKGILVAPSAQAAGGE